MYDAVAIGELLVDFACQSTDAGGYPVLAAHPGGAPANFLAVLAHYGMKTALLAKVGDDVFGRLLCRTAAQAGIDTVGIVVDGSVFTTLAFVTLDTDGDRDFSFARKPGADMLLRYDELNLSLIDQTRVFHFGSVSMTDEPSRDATRRAVEYARDQGKLVTYDPNLRTPLWKDLSQARQEILWGLSAADVVKISGEEVEFLWGLPPQDGAEKLLREYPATLVFVTCGADGCYYAGRQGAGHVGCPPVRTVDTTGAGDIFMGSAVAQLLRTGKCPQELEAEHLRQIAAAACAEASLSTEHYGGISSIRY